MLVHHPPACPESALLHWLLLRLPAHSWLRMQHLKSRRQERVGGGLEFFFKYFFIKNNIFDTSHSWRMPECCIRNSETSNDTLALECTCTGMQKGVKITELASLYCHVSIQFRKVQREVGKKDKEINIHTRLNENNMSQGHQSTTRQPTSQMIHCSWSGG